MSRGKNWKLDKFLDEYLEDMAVTGNVLKMKRVGWSKGDPICTRAWLFLNYYCGLPQNQGAMGPQDVQYLGWWKGYGVVTLQHPVLVNNIQGLSCRFPFINWIKTLKRTDSRKRDKMWFSLSYRLFKEVFPAFEKDGPLALRLVPWNEFVKRDPRIIDVTQWGEYNTLFAFIERKVTKNDRQIPPLTLDPCPPLPPVTTGEDEEQLPQSLAHD